MTTVFRSKIDGKLMAIGLAMPCVALIAIGTNARLATGLVWFLAILTVLVAVIVVWVVMSTYYEVGADELLARSGPFCWRIPLKDISAVRESNSPRSGPALSMDRLEITHANGRVLLISPGNKAAFLAALHRRAPWLAS